MKAAHRPDIFVFSQFDPARDLDFNGYVLVREGGNVVVDPVPMTEHDLEHLRKLGGAKWVVITNSDHVRASVEVATQFGAQICGPVAESDDFPVQCARWLDDGDELVPGVHVMAVYGSKTPGELVLRVDDTTLITGDLLRAPVGGSLTLLPDAKLRDRGAALTSVRRFADHPEIDAVLVGDGWPVFTGGHAALKRLVDERSG